MTNSTALQLTGQALLPPPSQFEAYARAVQQCPMLTEEREHELVAAWRQTQDGQAARELVMSHLRLVVRVVRDHRGYGLPEGDLAQEGTVGLMRAVHRFDPSVGVRLAAYAVRWIEAEIREFIFKNWRLVKLGGTAAMKKLFFGYRQTVTSLQEMGEQREPGVSPQVVAQAMGLTAEQVERAQAYFGGRDLALEAPAQDGEEGPSDALMLEALPALDDSPASRIEEQDRVSAVQAMVRSALAALPERDRTILVARRLTSPPRGLAEVGSDLGISAERVRQLENRAVKALEQSLASSGAPELLA